jgi:hypothetical protein
MRLLHPIPVKAAAGLRLLLTQSTRRRHDLRAARADAEPADVSFDLVDAADYRQATHDLTRHVDRLPAAGSSDPVAAAGFCVRLDEVLSCHFDMLAALAAAHPADPASPVADAMEHRQPREGHTCEVADWRAHNSLLCLVILWEFGIWILENIARSLSGDLGNLHALRKIGA